MSGSPRSEHFDDIYFAVENGLEETKHVFLGGNDLPERWQNRSRFTIAETGFGTGLNFISAWKCFEGTTAPHQKLHFISVEKYPLSPAQIKEYLFPWQGEIGSYVDRLTELYPLRTTGWHTLHLTDRVSLLLIFDDVNRAFPELDARIDAWFLDGHAPAKNPEMWSETVFSAMKRLSAPGATCATFTAAGVAKRGLKDAGFAIDKRRGFGRKRDMIVGRCAGQSLDISKTLIKTVAVIGGGLAGSTAAHALLRRGLHVDLFEKEKLGAGASGNPLGLFNPRFSAQRSAESDFFGSAYALAVSTFKSLQNKVDIGYKPCGSLHLMTDSDKEKRYANLHENWNWHSDHLSFLDAAEATECSGVSLNHACLFLPDSGVVSPEKLCQSLSAGATFIREEVAALKYVDGLWSLNGKKYDAVILANAASCLKFSQVANLPFHTVRGQLSFVTGAVPLKTNLCYGGYCSVEVKGSHVLGSTFQPWLTDTTLRAEDHERILGNFADAVPTLSGKFTVTGGRAALRTAAKDRIPVGGVVHGYPGLYISTAHGSHGLLSTLMIAEQLAAQCAGEDPVLPRSTLQLLSPSRFLQKL